MPSRPCAPAPQLLSRSRACTPRVSLCPPCRHPASARPPVERSRDCCLVPHRQLGRLRLGASSQQNGHTHQQHQPNSHPPKPRIHRCVYSPRHSLADPAHLSSPIPQKQHALSSCRVAKTPECPAHPDPALPAISHPEPLSASADVLSRHLHMEDLGPCTLLLDAPLGRNGHARPRSPAALAASSPARLRAAVRERSRRQTPTPEPAPAAPRVSVRAPPRSPLATLLGRAGTRCGRLGPASLRQLSVRDATRSPDPPRALPTLRARSFAGSSAASHQRRFCRRISTAGHAFAASAPAAHWHLAGRPALIAAHLS